MAQTPGEPGCAGLIGVAVLHYNSQESAKRLLVELERDLPEGTPIVVVDASGNFGAASEFWNADLTVLSRPDNPGYGAAMNLAASEMPDTEFLLFLTHDVGFEPGAIEILKRFLETHPEAGGCGPALKLPDGSIWSRGGFESRFLLRHGHHLEAHRPRPVDWLDGAALLVRRDLFGLLGGFREDYFLYYEDVEFGYRLRAAKRPLWLVPDAAGIQSQGAVPPYLTARNRVMYLRERRRWDLVLVAILVAAVRVSRSPRFLSGVVDGLSGRLRRNLVAASSSLDHPS